MNLKYYLIASERNNYQPWIIKPQAMVIFCLCIWSLRIFLPQSITFASGGIDSTYLMQLVNGERTQRFLPGLTTNSKLNSVATDKASDMLNRSYFSHIDPDGNYVWPRIEASGYKPYSTLGENLAMDFTSAESVVSAWMNSPTHRTNIVNEKFEDQGMAAIAGVFEPGHDSILIANLFGKLIKSTATASPQAATMQPKSPNPSPPKPVAQVQPTPPKSSTTTPPQTPPPKTATPLPKQESPSPVLIITINPDVQIKIEETPNATFVQIDAVISGGPTLVTAHLKGLAINLTKGSVEGQFLGKFTFDPVVAFNNENLIIEAHDKQANKTKSSFVVNSTPPAETFAANTPQTDKQFLNTLRIIFGIFASIYFIFLVIDSIIIHKARLTHPGISTHHLVIFFLLSVVNLLITWVS